MSVFSFGTTNPATTSTFGTPVPSSAFGGFGTPQASSAGKSLFGGVSAPTASTGFAFGGFGTLPKTTASSTFGAGTAFGSMAPSLGTSFSTGLGTGLTGRTGAFGMPAGTVAFGQQPTTGLVQPTQSLFPQQINPMVLMGVALSNPQIHGDERDGIIAKLNQLQAYWGTGKGYCNQQGVAVDFTPENPFCRFKVVGYSQLPTANNDDGFVSVEVKKKESEVRQQQQAFVNELHKCFGSKPTLMVCVDGLKPLPDDRTEIVIYVVERAENGTSKIYPANDVYTYLNQTNIKALLQTIGVVSISAKTSMSSALLQQYLDTPPAGIDKLLWEQAKKDNPDPQKYVEYPSRNRLIPVPIIGFSELKKRLKFQEQETSQHQKRLSIIGEEIATLQRNHATTMAKLAQFKRKHLELSHRVLEVMVKQESLRKAGYSVQADEEQIRVQLESIQAELNAPLQFKARLNELLSQIRLQQSQGVGHDGGEGRYVMDPALQGELKQHLEQQQVGMMHLISIIKDDIEDLKTIEQGLGENMVVR